MLKAWVVLGLALVVAECGNSAPSKRVVGGTDATWAESRAMVSLQRNSGGSSKHACGATVLREGWLLTAAHCVSTDKPPNRVLFNTTTLSEGGVEGTVVKVFPHPEFSVEERSNDVALVQYNGIDLEDIDSTFASVDIRNAWESPGNDVFVMGWGAVAESSNEGSDVLQYVELPLVSASECKQSFEAYGVSHLIEEEKMLCAGFQSGGADACNGDSGGPLFIRKNGKFVQLGVVSWGIGCAQPNRYGVYARMSYYADWIEDILSSNEEDEPENSKFCAKRRKKKKCNKVNTRCYWNSEQNECQSL